MNVPFVIAQAATSSGTSDGAVPIQTIKILKPDSGQAAVFHLSASGPVKIDLSAITDEKITLVHVGNDLIILFDNNTTATLDNFFDGTNPMPNVYVEVGDGRQLQSTVFASQFPVTSDPSVLPAAGDNGDSGHPFPGPEVDPLNGWGPLALQPGEELPNWQTTSFRLNDFINDLPSFGDNANVLLDEDFLEQSNGAPFNGNRDLPAASPGDNDGGASFSGIMHYNFHHDGPAATDPLVIDTASLSGLGITSQGSPVVFDWNSTTFTLTGYIDSDATPGLSGGDKTVLTLQFDPTDVTAAGDDHHFSVTLLAPLDQAPGGEENNWMLPLQITITDSNNDAVTGTVNLDIDDDMPVMGQGDRDWTLDEDVLTNGNDALDNPADPNDYTLIADKNLGVNWGADGPGTLSFAQTDATHPIITITDQNGNPVGPLQSNGADLIYSIATNTDGGQTLTATAGGNPIFTLTLDPDAGPNGTFTFNLQGHLDHPNDDGQNRLDLNFGFTANDHDHDPVDSSIVIRITDDVPYVIGRGENVGVNENDIVTPWSLGTSPGDGHTEPGSGAAIATGSLSGLVATGVDTPITWGFSADAITTMEALGLFSKQTALPDNGQGLTYTVTQIGGDMVLSASEPATPGIPGSGNIVFSFTLDQQTGDFTFRLFDELIHVAGDGTNTDLRSGGPTDGPGGTQASIPYIDFGSIITATDFDGDSVTLTDKVHVTVVDDVPQVQIGVDPLGVVQHDETPGVQNSILQFPPDLADSDTSFSSVKAMFAALEAGGQAGDDLDVSGTGAIGYAQSRLPVVFNADLLNLGIGADSPPQASTFSLQVTNGTYSGVQTTEGVNVYLYNENGLIVGRLGGDSDATPDQPDPNGLVAFAIAIEPDGKVDLAQYLSLNHPTSSNDDESISLASGSVRAVLSVTDSDGDTVTDSADISGHIRFDDDGPNVGRNPTVKVDDDVLDGNPSGTGDDADAVNTVGTLSHNYGSDGAGSTLLLDTGAPLGFVYAVSNGGTVLHISQNGIEVLRVTLTDTTSGNYEVEQLHAIDHPNAHNENNDTFNIAYRVTDGDGDHVNGRLTINVDDDTPVPLHVTSAAGEVFEDGLTGPLAFGNPEGAPGSQPTSIIITSAQLANLVSFGADVPGTFSLISSIGGNVQTADGVNVTSGGVQVKYAHAGADIIGYADVNNNNSFGGGDHEVFRLHDLGGGSFQFTLEGALDHLPLNAGGGDSETLILNLAAAFRATDHDGDSTNLGGVLAVSVENDVPLVVSDTTNYATNGDFTQGNWTPPAFWGSSATPGNVPGWNISGSPIDPPVSPPDNAITFERQANGFLGLFTSNGADMIDLGASGGNYELSQNVGAGAAPDLVAGQPYVIQFEAGAPFPETALIEVLWNNQVIGTIDTNVHTGQLEKYAFTVEGTGDPSTDKLTFREVGTGNLDLGTDGSGNDLQDERYHGTYIANVEIVAANGVVDEDGLNTPLSVGNGDSDQIGDAPGNSATVTGNLGVQWGADSTDTPDAGGVQDGAGSGLTGRTLTFADNLVETFGTLALTSAGDAVSFQLQDNGTKLVGVAGSDDRVVFTVTLSDDGTGAFTFTLFDQLDHAPGANENDIALKFHFTATDFDGDAANGSFIVAVDDDMPVLAVESSTEAIRNLALALDETVQPDNATNDPSFDHFNGAETESGGGTANGGADDVGGPLYNHTPVYDLSPNANQAIGSLATVAGSLAALFTVTPHYGADGPGAQAINSLLSLGLTGGTSLATTLTATALAGTPLESMTDAERAILLVQNGDAIEGRIAGTSTSGDEYVVFRISLNNASDPAQAQLAIDQFLPIDHGGTEDPSVFDEVASLLITGNGSVTLTDTVTITDGDNDQATTSSSVNLITGNATIVTFDDDGPVPAALLEVNLVNNGLFFTGFVENGDVWGAQSGVANGTAGDWIVSPSGGGGATQLERVGEPYGGADSPTNSLIVDLEATPGNVQISQDLHGLVDGEKYLLTFEVGEANFGNAKLEVIWNGTVIATIDPNPGLMQTVALELEASGPSGTLTFKEVGTAGDNTGTYLANVHVTNVVIIDETPGVDADSNDTTDLLVKALFQNVDHPGSDPDMSPQFATGTGAVVNVAAPDYGTDGPAAQQALQYGLHVANATSGLTTTENQSIELFVENGIIVGRYDSDGSGSVTADDNAAFAIAIDADTGVLSVAQYVSLHHPDTGKADEGIQLAAGTIVVDVTLTDGDGDKAVSSADISNHVLFQDDGPAARYSGRLTVQEDAASDGSFIVQTVPGHFLFDGGADGAAITSIGYGFAGERINDPDAPTGPGIPFPLVELTSGGQEITIAHAPGDPLTLIGTRTDGKEVFRVHVTDATTGAYSFTQSAPIDHPDHNESGAADPLRMKITFTVTDGDGDTASSSNQIDILDDAPVTTGVIMSPTTLDDDVFGGNSGGDNDGPDATTATGGPGALFDAGADGVKNVTLDSASGFKAIYVDANGVGHQESVQHTATVAADGTTTWTFFSEHIANVATLTIGADGSYNFTTHAPLVHPNSNVIEEYLPLTFDYTVTDGDNDAASGSLTINVNDDTPTLTQIYRYNNVYESQLTGGSVDSSTHFAVSFGADGYGAGKFTGAIKLDIGPGLAGNISFNVAGVEHTSSQFTSDGRPVTFRLVDDHTILGYVTSANNGDQGDVNVIELRLSSDNTNVTTTLFQPVDHIAAEDGSPISTLVVDASVIFTDGDNDPVGGIIRTTIHDDTPTLDVGPAAQPDNLDLALDETVQPDNATNDPTFDHFNGAETESGGGAANGGADDVGGPLYNHTPVYDLNPNANQAIGSLTTAAGAIASQFYVSATFGADGPGANSGLSQTLSLQLSSAIAATNLIATDTGDTHVAGLSDAARAIVLYQVSDTVIEGRIAGADGIFDGNGTDEYTAFRITLNNASDPSTAAITVDQFMAIDHGGTEDPSVYDENTILHLVNGTLNLKLDVTATDGDLDSVQKSVSLNLVDGNGSFISFDDDGPQVLAVTPTTGPNLVQNGSFEDGHADIGASDWSIYSSLGDASLAGVWTWGPDHIPFEVQTGGSGGLGPKDGNTLIELDGDTEGNPVHTPQGIPDPVVSNATIQQVIAGTEAGQTYELSFWYAPRPGDGANSSGMQVFFEGNLVYDIPASPNPPAGWQLITLQVTATGPNAVLAFTGTGGENEFGALLDNVNLHAVTILDDEDTTLNPAVEIQGGPGDDGHGVTATGKIEFDASTDGLHSIELHGIDGLQAIYVDASGVGHPESVSYNWVADGSGGGTLTGFTADLPTVFTMTVDASGNYTFHLVAPLDHPLTDDSSTATVETSFEDNLNLDFGFTITDGDGDSATGNIVINVDDDSPVAANDTDAVTNGLQTLNFDDIPLADGQEKPLSTYTEYGGFIFSQTGVYNPGGGTYDPTSGQNLAFIGEKDGNQHDGYLGVPGDPITIEKANGELFAPKGLTLSSNSADPLTVVITAYDAGNNITGTITVNNVHQGSATPVDLSSLDVVDHITIDTPGGANSLYFGFDDFTYIDIHGSTTGNVISGIDTTSGIAGADAAGADGGRITAIAFGNNIATAEDANGNFNVTGAHGSLIINADGTYTYTQTDITGGQDVFTYTLTDGDGDAVTATLTITSPNIIPALVAGNDVQGTVEEEQLGHIANPAFPVSSVGNEDTGSADSNDHDTATTPPGSDVTTNATTGTLNVTGGLGPYTFQFSSSVDGHQAVFTDGSSVTSGGQPVLYSIQGDTLIGYVNSDAPGYTAGTDHVVFTIVLDSTTSTDGTDGYTFTLYDHLDHNGTQNSQFGDNKEGTLSLNLSGFVTVTDSSGINAPVTLNGTIDVIDDTPIAVDGTVNEETVHEDGLTGLSTGNPDAGGNATTATIHASDLASLVLFGADSPGTITLTQSLSGAVRTTDGTTLLSKSVEVHYAQDGSDIIGVAEDAGGTREVFRLHDNGDGTFTFALEDQVDHIPNDPADNDTQTLAINLASAFTATDSDGDSVQLTRGTIAVTVEDDIPYFGTTTDATVTQLHQLVSGTFDFHIGADEPSHFAITPPTIDGVTTHTSTDAITGIITVTATFDTGGGTFYVMNVNPNGTYSFELDGFPTTTTTLADVNLNDSFGPTSQRDYGSFTLASDQNINGSTQGVGVGSNGMDDGEHVTVQFDNPLSVANLGINFSGSGNITLSWKAIDTATGHYETGTGTFSADGALTIDILNHVQGADADPLSSDISRFDKIEISGTGDNSAHARISSIGGTEITENHNVGPFNFTLTGTDHDGDQAQTTLSIDTAINGLPLAIDASVGADEDNLFMPPADFAGNQDTPAASTGDDSPSDPTGHIANFGPDGAGNISFNVTNDQLVTDTSSTVVRSGGQELHYFWDGGDTLYASTNAANAAAAEDTAAFKIVLTQNASGANYTFTLLNHLDHPLGDNENNISIDVPFTVTDSTPDSDPGVIHVNIDDDMPVANPDSAETTEGAKPTLNAILVLDLSLSMGPQGGDPDGPGGFTTRLALMQAAVENFLSNSNVTFNQITVYSFGVGAELVGQFTIGENNYIQNAIDTVNGFDSGDLSAGTQYDSAANLVDGRTGSADRYANLSHPAADETNIYFLSDGDPQSGNDLNTNERADWSNFLSDSNINQVYALGFSNGASTTFLSQIAPRSGDVARAVTDPTELSATLTGALPSSVSGNVLTDAPGAGSFGADGGHIQSITINGVTHDYAPGDATHITGTDKDGGKLTFYFADDSDGHHAGDYSYTAPDSVTGDQTETFHYVLVDGDGDTAEADLTITVHDTVPMVANDDIVLTNIVDGSDIVVPSPAMLINDLAGTGSGSLDITSVQDPTGGTVQLGSAIFTPFSIAPQTLIDANFDSGTEGFTYQDDVFRNTNESSHADGERDDDALRVRLGGDNNRQGPMSGGWQEAFLLAAATTVTISFDYTLALSGETDSGENAQVLMSLDGSLHGTGGNDYIAQLSGSGGNNDSNTSGHFELMLDLGAGNHTIDLGAYMTGENDRGETTTAYFDNVSVVAAGHPFVSGSYNYTANDGHTNDDAHVIIVAQNGNMITGTDANEILVADGHHVEINAAVHSGSTFNADDDQGFSFDYTAGAPGVSITQIQIDVSGIGRFDQSGGSSSRGFDLGSNSDVTPASVTPGDTTVLTLNFNTGDFNVGDQLRFAIDTDNGTHSLENGGDFGDQGVPFKITLSDGTILNGVYQSDGNASHATVTTDFGSMLLGEGGDDYLVGSDGGDTLVGGLGADILQGGAGADHFLYNAPGEGLDHILDFNGSEGDTVDILAAAFGLTAGADTAGIFDSSGDANFTSSTERFHFDTTGHTLYYDADGNSGSASVALATFDNDATIQAHNIHLV